MDGAPRVAPFPRLVSFFRRHPILLLLGLTPGIPEYLSGSSSFVVLARNPVVFFLFLGLNLGLYGPGVLLAREAFVRWRPGWAGMVLLGTAYALLEEGTALSTMFNPAASVVGTQGFYGHFVGVNWVWAFGVSGIHIVLSVGLPILLLGLALPETRGRSLLHGRGIGWAVGIYAVDIVALAAIVGYWRVAPVLLVAAAVLALLLYAAAHALPKGTLDPTGSGPTLAPKWFFPLGLLFYPILVLVPGLGSQYALWPPIDVALELLLGGALFLFVRQRAGRAGNEAALTMLALGTIAPIVFLGALFQVAFPIVLFADVLFVLFFYALWVRYRPGPTFPLPAPPAGAM
jgi:hypothetical protein